MKRWQDRYSFAALLNLLLPGLGHCFWREYLFGVFIFLIMLITVLLFYVSMIISLPYGFKLVLFILPAIFYLFTFFDLKNVVNKKRKKPSSNQKYGIAILFLQLLFKYYHLYLRETLF